MRRTLNPNAGEFHPNNNSGGNTGSGTTTISNANSNPNPNTNTNMNINFNHTNSNNSVESNYFMPVTRSLMEFRVAFFRHSGSMSLMRHVEFERLLRRCFFAAHNRNGLSVSSSTVCDRCKPFWLSFSPAYLQLAREVVLEIELGIVSQSTTTTTTGTTTTTKSTADSVNSNSNSNSGNPRQANGSHNNGNIPREEKKEKEGEEMETGKTSLEAQEMLLKREQLREVYLLSIRPLIPCLLLKELANCTKRSNSVCSDNIKDAMMYALDVFFLFTRIQFLPFLDTSTVTSYSACVQYITRLRERLLRPDVAEPFLNLVLVLMLLSSIHQSSMSCAMEINTTTTTTTPTKNKGNSKVSNVKSNENEEEGLSHKVQWLFCRYFPALVVSFLAVSPLQSVEELRNCFTANNVDDCLPVLRSSPRGVAAIRELFSYDSKSAILWNKTLTEVISFAMRHLDGEDHNSVGFHNNMNELFLLTKYTALDDHMHVNYPTVLNCLLNLTDNVTEASHLSHLHHQHQHQHQPHQHQQSHHEYQCQQKHYRVQSLRSEEFHRMAMRAAAGSTGGEYDTVYFSLMALVNMECFPAAELSRLFSTLADAYGCCCPYYNYTSTCCCCCDGFNDFLASPVCAALRPAARELLDVLYALTPNNNRSGSSSLNNSSNSNSDHSKRSEHLQALREVEEMLFLLPQPSQA
ncbi:uncharacterized protein TM35_000014680 [Trypanosoma theileri]|uniref:Uncharacterized protein n=1 Tax=Trypanosoma theileri TaxID=67003 RepID=A0A1X0P9T4_9TRYP|nr:uncharacterized protein TM35_000014680 [Trypanosoma theileri]ORC93591.1 hypothetical protein TM35_000014680 [Trypanosoma theileri]